MLGSIGLPEMLVLFLLGVLMLPKIFYMLMLQRTLDNCAHENRTMSSGLVWLLLIPMVDLLWHFYVVKNIAESLGREFRQRGLAIEPNPGRDLGYTMGALNIAVIMPIIGIFAGIGGFVCWIMYWIKVSGFSKRLMTQS